MSEVGFSIIIPVYNAEKIINQTIDSLKKIAYENYEVILVNDGSTDETERMIKQAIDGCGIFRLITTDNQGPGLARNRGIVDASKDYLLFFDADDLPQTSILTDYNKIYSQNSDVDLIVSSFTYVTKKNDQIASKKNYLVDKKIYNSNHEFLNDMYYLMSKQLMYVVWNKCYKSKLIKKNNIRFKDYQSCEDRIFNLEYFKFCNNVAMNPKIEYIYEFESGRGITNKYSKDKYKTFKEFYEIANEVTNGKSTSGIASLFLKGCTSVMFSIVNNDDLRNIEKRVEIETILNDSSIVEAKKIALTDTKSKWLLKRVFNLPSSLFIIVINAGNFVELKLPGIMSVLKKVY